MNEQLYILVTNLKQSIDNDNRVIELNNIEKDLENNTTIKVLSFKMDNACREYNDILKIYPSDSPIAKQYLIKLHEAKKELDKLDIVKKYNKSYRLVKEMYDEINKQLFYPFSGFNCKKR